MLFYDVTVEHDVAGTSSVISVRKLGRRVTEINIKKIKIRVQISFQKYETIM